VIKIWKERFPQFWPEGYRFYGPVRANDPIYELSFRMKFGHKSEDLFWVKTLKALAAYLGSSSETEQTAICVDPRMQWSEAKNIWHNAAARTGICLMMTPFRWAGGLLNRNA
jgi:hypothetical protein